MKRLGLVTSLALLGAIAAFITFSLPGRRGCELTGQQDRAFRARFLGPLSVSQTSHVLLVTRGAQPVSPGAVCVNTEMVGMSGMGYSDSARPLGRGRYRVQFQFGMAGTYTGNVVVTRHGSQISIPVRIHVSQPGS
jgi:hypothetical protein